MNGMVLINKQADVSIHLREVFRILSSGVMPVNGDDSLKILLGLRLAPVRCGDVQIGEVLKGLDHLIVIFAPRKTNEVNTNTTEEEQIQRVSSYSASSRWASSCR
jgi:hypothetical protein